MNATDPPVDEVKRVIVGALYRKLGKRAPHEALWIFAVEIVVWWHEAGQYFYASGRAQEDDGLAGIAADAVHLIGGEAVAREVVKYLSEQQPADAFAALSALMKDRRPSGLRAIHLPPDTDN